MTKAHDKGEPFNEEKFSTPYNYFVSKTETEKEHSKPLLEGTSDGHVKNVVTKEPNAYSDSVKWSPSLSNGKLQMINDSSLVDLESDDEDGSLLTSTHATSAQQVTRQLTFQLAKDGYQLDQTPDNDQIDLFPTKDFSHPPACCQAGGFSCAIS